jgi:hypothetical protein
VELSISARHSHRIVRVPSIFAPHAFGVGRVVLRGLLLLEIRVPPLLILIVGAVKDSCFQLSLFIINFKVFVQLCFLQFSEVLDDETFGAWKV